MGEPLHGIRVVDLTQALAGPYATMLLGDMGADVIKVEMPDAGDQSRGWGPPFLSGESAYYLCCNRNKRSLTLNIAAPAGQEILFELLAQADIFITNIPRLESLRRYGLDFESVHARFPRVIMCAISGFGMSGPYAGRPGYDLIAQALSGTMSLTGPAEEDGEPYRFPTAIADISAGIYAVVGILGALVGRHASGEGQFIDISLLDSQITWLSYVAANYFATGKRPKRQGNQHPSIVPYQPFRARDKHFLACVGTEKLWRQFCQALGLADTLMEDGRFSSNAARHTHRAELIELLSNRFASEDAGYWLKLLEEAEIPCSPINTVDELFQEPQALARGVVVELEHPAIGMIRSIANPVRFSSTPVTYRRHPPRLGEHSGEILAGLGRTPSQIQTLRDAGVL